MIELLLESGAPQGTNPAWSGLRYLRAMEPLHGILFSTSEKAQAMMGSGTALSLAGLQLPQALPDQAPTPGSYLIVGDF